MQKNLEEVFHQEMLAIYDKCATIGYYPREFRRMVLEHKGVGAAKRLIHRPETTGLNRLASEGKLEWSMEYLMADTRFSALFDEKELHTARHRVGIPRRP
ncbi:hypothetical protein [Pararhizobium sp. O133]|uniref:hypothetical protein n=1 Tax=Pararhizobium sp. O133 TaxID=3449278 RepID=UPI003F68919C